MRINALRSPVLVFAALTAVFVPLMTSSHAALGLTAHGAASPSASDSAAASGSDSAVPSGSDSASPSASDSAAASGSDSAVPSGSDSAVPSGSDSASPSASHSAPATPAPLGHRASPKPPSTGETPGRRPTIAEQGAFYRSVLDLRPDLPGLSNQQYYYIGRAFCSSPALDEDELGEVQQAYGMPAGTLAYDSSMTEAILQTAPMQFVQEHQIEFGFDGSDIDGATLNAFRRKLCANHSLWLAYAVFVRAQLGTLGPWRTDPSYAEDPGQTAQLWHDDLSAWEAALGPWLPRGMRAS